MNKRLMMAMILMSALLFVMTNASAQCSLCTKTASQLGEKPAAALNSAIIYLMAAPFAIVGFIGWRWWKSQKDAEE
jgi:TRAP-type C4-dicarboxylate transport system permease small subunit